MASTSGSSPSFLPQRPSRARNGTLVMCSTPPAMATALSPSLTLWAALTIAWSPEAHALWIVNAGTWSPSSARRTIWRARLGPLPAMRAWPTITSSTAAAGTPARDTASRATIPPSSAAEERASPPPKRPIGVRTPPASRTRGVLTSGPASAPARAGARSSPSAPALRDPALGRPGAARALHRLALAGAGNRLLLRLERLALGLAQPSDRRLGAGALGVVLALGLLARAGRPGAAGRGDARRRLRGPTPRRAAGSAVLRAGRNPARRLGALVHRLADRGACRRRVALEWLGELLLERFGLGLVGHLAERDRVSVRIECVGEGAVAAIGGRRDETQSGRRALLVPGAQVRDREPDRDRARVMAFAAARAARMEAEARLPGRELHPPRRFERRRQAQPVAVEVLLRFHVAAVDHRRKRQTVPDRHRRGVLPERDLGSLGILEHEGASPLRVRDPAGVDRHTTRRELLDPRLELARGKNELHPAQRRIHAQRQRRPGGIELHPLGRLLENAQPHLFLVEPTHARHVTGEDHDKHQTIHTHLYSRFIHTLLTCV